MISPLPPPPPPPQPAAEPDFPAWPQIVAEAVKKFDAHVRQSGRVPDQRELALVEAGAWACVYRIQQHAKALQSIQSFPA